MRNYLAAECYKTFRRKYFYIALAVCLGLLPGSGIPPVALALYRGGSFG